MLLFCFLYTMKDFSQNVCDKHVINTTRKKIIKTRGFFFLFFFFLLFKVIPPSIRETMSCSDLGEPGA